MNAKPIIFNGPMIRALIDGRKSQTRRVAKLTSGGHLKEPNGHRRWHPQDENAVLACPYGQPGDLLWCRETFAIESNRDYQDVYARPESPLGPIQWHSNSCDDTQWFECPRYLASEPETLLVTPDDEIPDAMRWHPSIHMPRWASRLTLRITDVRVQRVQEISEADEEAEGIGYLMEDPDTAAGHAFNEAEHYAIAGVPMPHSPERFGTIAYFDDVGIPWDANPWVWAISFEVVHANVDDVLNQREAA